MLPPPASESRELGKLRARYFNTSGPVVPEEHYCIPPLARLSLAELRQLIDRRRYFVLHAPRQTGKTSALLALQDLLNAEGRYRGVYVNVEAGQAMREDVTAATQVILSQMARQARRAGDEYLTRAWSGIFAEHGSGALGEALSRWARAAEKPLVLLIDEIDALVGDSLLSVLRQLRADYPHRTEQFPQSVVLCGVRDVRDYRIHSGSANEVVAGGSAFNIKAESLRMGDFSRDEVSALLGQHVEETGQTFAADALKAVWTQTRGQPWLVNALAYETCFRGDATTDRSRTVTEAEVLEAKERLILRRDTHLDQLTDKLREARVRRVIEPLLVGGDGFESTADDIEYVQDLGLIALDPPLRIANPIYAEVVPRQLTWSTQLKIRDDPAWFVDAEDGLQLETLLARFQEFFRENAESWIERFEYKEAGPQLLLQAFLRRVVNSGGRVEREQGLGRRRADLLIEWPLGKAVRKYVVECKVRRERRGKERTVAEGVEQTAAYMDRCGAEAGHLVVFDRSEERSWDEKVFRESRTARSGVEITVWGM